jgi:hypothetical protein
LPIDLSAISAPFVFETIVSIAHVHNGGVQARNGQVFQENVAFAATSDAKGVLAHFIDAPWVLALFDTHQAQASLWASIA